MLTAVEAGATAASLIGTRRVTIRDPRFPNFVARLRTPGGPIVGFSFWPLRDGDREKAESALEALILFGEAPRFEVPELGLRGASIAEIIQAARRDLSPKPTPDAALWNQASALTGLGKDPDGKALSLWRQCLESGEPGAHLRIGTCLLKDGRTEEAEHHFREFISVVPLDPEGWWYLGRALRRLGDLEGAYRAFGFAVEHCVDLEPPLSPWLRQQIRQDYVETDSARES